MTLPSMIIATNLYLANSLLQEKIQPKKWFTLAALTCNWLLKHVHFRLFIIIKTLLLLIKIVGQVSLDDQWTISIRLRLVLAKYQIGAHNGYRYRVRVTDTDRVCQCQCCGQVQLVKYSNTSSTLDQVQVQVLCIFDNQVLKYIKYWHVKYKYKCKCKWSSTIGQVLKYFKYFGSSTSTSTLHFRQSSTQVHQVLTRQVQVQVQAQVQVHILILIS